MILEQLNNLFADYFHLLIRKNECTNSIHLMVLFCNDYIKWHFLSVIITNMLICFHTREYKSPEKGICVFSGHHCILRTQHNAYKIMKKN